jgi:hypothetical protein
VATGRTAERVLASLGTLSQARLQFEHCQDVAGAGVLCALPALLAVGLLRGVRECFAWAKGYYPLESIFLTLALMALARVRSIEALRYEPPGEWGKLLGLDRLPEVKTLRQKLEWLCQDPEPSAQWGQQLAVEWMAANTQHSGFYYVDGHVRVYHGQAAVRPRTYVAREKLCLRASLDYWVNAMDGQPFFVLTQDLNERLVQTLQEEIVPRLKAEAPGQPTEAQLAADPRLHRFVILFDREGYSPQLFKEWHEQRIAITTYAKRCKATEDWPVEEFTPRQVTLVSGETVEFMMAERRVALSNGFEVREVRHRDEAGHQTAILSTDFIHPLEKVAATLFARWCQENFFRYMMEHYALDRFVQYGAEPIPDPNKKVVNPQRRKLEKELRRERTLLSRSQAQLGAQGFPTSSGPEEVARFEQAQGELLQGIEKHQSTIEELKRQRPSVPKHVPLKDLPEAERITRLRSVSKHFVDTIKMIAYRAETALAGLAREKLRRPEDARALIRQLLQSSANLIPDPEHKTLTVAVHPLTNAAHNEVVQHLCEQLTETETLYPTTDLRLIFKLLGSS